MATGLPRRDFLTAASMPLVAAALARYAMGQAAAPALPGGAAGTKPMPSLGGTPPPRTLGPGSDPRSRIICYYLIGGSSNVDGDRRIGTVSKSGGWKTFIESNVKPAYQWGCKRFWVHWPFGIGTLTTSTEWDQYLKAKYTGMTWLTDDFVKQWQPLQAGSLGAPLDVTAYIGRCYGDPAFSSLLDQGKRSEWLVRAVASVVPFLQCNMNLGVDAAVGVPDTQPDINLCELLQALGTTIYVESRPLKQYSRWSQFNIVCDAGFWYTSDPAMNPAASWAVRNADMHGEVVRGFFSPLPGKTWEDISWQISEARKILKDGNTVLLNVNYMMSKGVKIGDLVNNL